MNLALVPVDTGSISYCILGTDCLIWGMKNDNSQIDTTPILAVLMHIAESSTFLHEQVLTLYERYDSFIAVETIVHIAMTRQMPLWAAEELWNSHAYEQE